MCNYIVTFYYDEEFDAKEITEMFINMKLEDIYDNLNEKYSYFVIKYIFKD